MRDQTRAQDPSRSIRTNALIKYLDLTALTTLLMACGPADLSDADSKKNPSTLDLNYNWQPFKQTSVWNLALAATRTETNIPSAAWTYGRLAPSDAEYGIKVYFAQASDPLWKVSFSDYNTVLDVWNTRSPTSIRAPAGMTPPTGSDGTTILIDPTLHYGYEIWQFSPRGGTSAASSSVNVVDLQSLGIHRNVGITGSGLPGIGGLLKSWELKNNVPIRHKLWLAVHPKLLYAQHVYPATAHDIRVSGSAAFVKFGEVIALSKRYDIDTNACKLSPFMKRIARALQDYGGLVSDQSGDAIDVVAEVNSVRDAIDINYNSTMWTQFGCLQKYLVKVNDPWVGAVPGGLGVP